MGNVVDPLKVMEQSGADILRLWTLNSDYSEDIRIGKDSIKYTGDIYRRIRNTLRFLLGALDGFTKEEAVFSHSDRPQGAEESSNTGMRSLDYARDDDVKKLPELEQLMLHQLTEMDKKVQDCIENYQFQKLTRELHDFCNENLSAFYFDIRKDRLYCDDPNSFERRATRSVMAEIFSCLTAWFAPILCFTAEEAWSHRPQGVFEDVDSVHLRDFPSVPESWHNPALAGKWFAIRELRKKVQEAIEPMRASKELGSSLEAMPVLSLDKDMMQAVEGRDMADICITSQVKIKEGAPSIIIEKAQGSKCERCWKVLPEVADNGELCNRCADVEPVKKLQKAA